MVIPVADLAPQRHQYAPRQFDSLAQEEVNDIIGKVLGARIQDALYFTSRYLHEFRLHAAPPIREAPQETKDALEAAQKVIDEMLVRSRTMGGRR